MNLKIEYRNIHFEISLERERTSTHLLATTDKINQLSKQTIAEIHKGKLTGYSVIITSTQDNQEFKHYFGNILLTTDDDQLVEELQCYLEQENILDEIASTLIRYAIDPGPYWKIEPITN